MSYVHAFSQPTEVHQWRTVDGDFWLVGLKSTDVYILHKFMSYFSVQPDSHLEHITGNLMEKKSSHPPLLHWHLKLSFIRPPSAAGVITQRSVGAAALKAQPPIDLNGGYLAGVGPLIWAPKTMYFLCGFTKCAEAAAILSGNVFQLNMPTVPQGQDLYKANSVKVTDSNVQPDFNSLLFFESNPISWLGLRQVMR